MISDHFRHLFQDHEGLRRQVENLSEGGRSLPRAELKNRCVQLCDDFDDHLEQTKSYLHSLPVDEDVEELKRSFGQDCEDIFEEIEAIKQLNHQAKRFYDEALRHIKAVETKISFARSKLTEYRGKVLRIQLERLETEVRKGFGRPD